MVTEKVRFDRFMEIVTHDFVEEKKKYNISPLFRGQGNSEWRLESTLQRHLKSGKISSTQYLESIKSGYSSVLGETVHAKLNYLLPLHELVTFGDYSSLGNDYQKSSSLSHYSFLRHIGVPSPLIDWTFDYRLALFFAIEHQESLEYVPDFLKIYYITQMTRSGSGDLHGQYVVEFLGYNFFSHPRHLLQKSDYTYGLSPNTENSEDPIIYQDTDKSSLVHLNALCIASKEVPRIKKWLREEENISNDTVYGSGENIGNTPIEDRLRSAIESELLKYLIVD